MPGLSRRAAQAWQAVDGVRRAPFKPTARGCGRPAPGPARRGLSAAFEGAVDPAGQVEGIGLPKGLFPLDDMQEFGYNREAGFMWLVRGKKKVEHTFKKIRQTVS